jgi:hypothetical protein
MVHMRTGTTPNNEATLFLPLRTSLGRELAGPITVPVDGRVGSLYKHGGETRIAVNEGPRRGYSRETVVNRLLDWHDEARRAGRAERADFLVYLAWEAYDRLAAMPTPVHPVFDPVLLTQLPADHLRHLALADAAD